VAPTSGWPGSAGTRWVVERTLGWLLSEKRLALRYDRTALTITALARLAVSLFCARRLPRN
jgi:transposase